MASRSSGLTWRFSQTKARLGWVSLCPQPFGLEIGHRGGEQFHRLVDVDDLARIGIERGNRDVGRQHHAVAVDDIGPRQTIHMHRRLALSGQPALQREVAELGCDGEKARAETDADQPDAVAAGKQRRAIGCGHRVVVRSGRHGSLHLFENVADRVLALFHQPDGRLGRNPLAQLIEPDDLRCTEAFEAEMLPRQPLQIGRAASGCSTRHSAV